MLALTSGLALPGSAVTAELGPGARWEQQAEQGGVTARVSLQAVGAPRLAAGAQARLRVALSAAHDDSPIGRVLPGAWIDAAPTGGDDDDDDDDEACQQRVTRYLRSSGVGALAYVDLNGYDVLVMNADASISVLDPRTQFAGKTSLRSTLQLPGPGFDWAATADDTRLFVSVPSAGVLAAADLIDMKTVTTIALPGSPGRVRLHPSGAQVWVGIPGTGAVGDGGVAIVQALPPHRVQWLPLGKGHAEIAFDPAGWAAVSHREEAKVFFVDTTVQRLVHSAALPAGAMPVGVIFDAGARRFIVADARGGRLLAFDHRGQALAALPLKPGIGPMALSADGRWLFVVNPAGHHVDIVDLPAWRAAHRLPVSGRPFAVAFSDAYAYVRALDTESVLLVALASLEVSPRVQVIAIGERAPGRTPNLPIAGAIVPMPDGTGGFIVSPGDNAVYYYMEGMNAPAGSISARGHEARAVRVARHGLREVTAGVFEALVTLPSAANLVISLATDSPRTRQCLSLALAPPLLPDAAPWQLAWELPSGRGSELGLRILGVERSLLPASLHLRLFQPGGGEVVPLVARPHGEGRYVAPLPALAAGVWYAHPVPPSSSGAKWSYASFVRMEHRP